MKEKNKKSAVLMKRMLSALCSVCIGASSVLGSASALYANAEIADYGDEYVFSGDVSQAKSKPVLTVSKKTVSAETAPGQEVEISIDLSGENIDNMFCTTGLHIFWDSRLTLVPANEDDLVTFGKAVKKMQCEAVKIKDASGIVIATSHSENAGVSGNILTLKLRLPQDAKPLDVYPIDIAYQTRPLMSDLFTNNKDDENGHLMQAWFFTKGINSKQNPSDDELLIASNADFADGYIAVAEAVTTTSTTTSTTTTKPTTTTSTTTSTTTTKPTTTTSTTTSTTTAKPTTTTSTTTSTTTTKPTTTTTTSTTTTTTTTTTSTTTSTTTTTTPTTTSTTTSTTTTKPTTTTTTTTSTTTTTKPVTTTTTSPEFKCSVKFVDESDKPIKDVRFTIKAGKQNIGPYTSDGKAYRFTFKEEIGYITVISVPEEYYLPESETAFSMWNSDIVIKLKSRPVTTTTAKKTTTTTTTTVTTTTIPVKPVINYGDVNGDKKVDSRDASAVLIEYAKSSTVAGGSFTEAQKLAADINGDKKVDSRDASAILLYYALSSTNKYSRIEDFMADYFKK